jgi:GNAT superfamily N-acetyltransferase
MALIADITIRSWREIADVRRLVPQVEAIFFEASGRTFASAAERAAFRERWLGRYLRWDADHFFLAMLGEDKVAGYLAGSLDNPAQNARFGDIAYFRTDFADLCRRFPAHLHINLAPPHRNCGWGTRLIEVFAAHARRAEAPGVHVVTGKGARNVRFYERCGFAPLATTSWNGRDVIFMGRELA